MITAARRSAWFYRFATLAKIVLATVQGLYVSFDLGLASRALEPWPVAQQVFGISVLGLSLAVGILMYQALRLVPPFPPGEKQ